MTEQAAPSNKAMLWGGRVLSAIPTLMLLSSAIMKFLHKPEMVQGFVGKFGYPENTLTVLGVVELLSTLLYVIPQTSVLGAVLLTGYLGGAVATHVRVGDPFVAPFLVGVLVWAGLFLRDARIRALLPLRRPTGG